MKFAKICFAKQYENRHVYSVYDRLPALMRRFYYLNIYKRQYTRFSLLSAEAVAARLPFEKGEADFELAEKYISKTVEDLKGMGAEVFSVQDGIGLPYGINISDGAGLLCAEAERIAGMACKARGLGLDEADIAIRDGGNDLTCILLYALSKKASKLWLYTLRADKLKPVLSEIFERTGLCVGTFSAENSPFMAKADIIINLNKGGGVINCFAKNSVYIDMVKDRKNTNRLYRLRKDMCVVRGFRLKVGERNISPEDAQAALFVINPAFREMISDGFTFNRFERAGKFLGSLCIDIESGFNFTGGEVKS